MNLIDPKIPRWLKLLFTFFLLLAIISLFDSPFGKYNIPFQLTDFALILTLAILIIYTYFTYSIAKEAWTPSASFALEQTRDDLYHFRFILKNHSKVPLECWCKLNASIYGKSVSIGGFYNGESSFDLQPFAQSSGYFGLSKIIKKANLNIEDLEKKANDENYKKQLYLDIEFWYNPKGSGNVIENPKQPHFFDFRRKIMVADF